MSKRRCEWGYDGDKRRKCPIRPSVRAVSTDHKGRVFHMFFCAEHGDESRIYMQFVHERFPNLPVPDYRPLEAAS